MNKKYTIVIIIIVILMFIGFTEYTKISHDEKVINLNGTNFTIPDKYHESGSNKNGHINITNGTNSFFIGYYKDPYIKSHINEYFNYSSNKNQTVSFSNLTVENNLVYKTVNNQNHVRSYWFEKNNQTYLIHDGGDNSIEESTFLDLIKSTNN